MQKTLVQRDKEVIWHPYTQQMYAPDPIPVVKGEGVYLFDETGRSYIDAISSWWVNLHGHGHPYIAAKIYEQAKTLEQVIFAGFTHQPAVALAERLLEIIPGKFSKVFYSDNGSTAVEVAIKMSLQYWWNSSISSESGARRRELPPEIAADKEHSPGTMDLPPTANHQQSTARNKILALSNSYHGDTFGAMSISDRGVFTLAFQDKLFDVVFLDVDKLEDITETLSTGVLSNQSAGGEVSVSIPVGEIACFIYEPMLQAAGGMLMYDGKILDRFLSKLKELNVICIADEVMTGFGRTGKLFASEYLSTEADIVCLSKGITGGTMALGVTLCKKEIHDAFVSSDRLKTFFHGHSYTANPLACVAALASLDLILKPGCMQSIKRITGQHQAFLEKLRSTTSSKSAFHTKNHRCLGTVLAFEIDTGRDEYLNAISAAVTKSALENGVFLRPLGNTVYVMPPYCITDAELQKVYDVILHIVAG